MKIEIIGLPGSGKTFLSQEKALELNISVLLIKKKIYKYFFVLFFCFYRFYFFIFILRLIYVENNKNKKVLKHKLYLFSEYIAVESRCFFSDKYIVDQGFMNLPFSVFDRKIKENDLIVFLKYYNKSCRNRKIFLLETEEGVRQKRIKGRGRRPRSFLGQDYAIKIDNILFINKNIIYNFYLKNIKNCEILKN